MKNIIYIIDSLSPLALKCLSDSFYGKKNTKNTIFDQLINKSIIFKNVYGHGETYSTIYSALTGKDIYKNNCDSWTNKDSFKEVSDLGKIFKSMNFTNIYMRNASPNNILTGFYGRFLNSISKDFDYKLLQKKHKNDNFSKFIKDQNLNKKLKNKNKNFFILIHDYTLHDSKAAYNGNHKKIINVIDGELTNNFKKTLSEINYNTKEDNLIVFSDHGLTKFPESNLFTKNEINKNDYDNYYKNIFLDEKIKMLFFIKNPHLKKKIIIENIYSAKYLHLIIKSFFHNYKSIKKFINFLNSLNLNFLITSIRSTRATIYENYFDKHNFHNHAIFIKKNEKIIFSNKHPTKYLIEDNGKFKKINNLSIVDNRFKNWIDEYYSHRNKVRKYYQFFIYKVFRIFKKIFR